MQFRTILGTLAYLLFILVAACSQIQTPQETQQTALPTSGSYPQPDDGSLLPPTNRPYPHPDTGVSAPDTSTYPAPWQPAAGDENMQRGIVYIDEQNILITESFPPQFELALKGNLPTPCHQLRVQIPEPDRSNQIQVEVYSLVKPGEICIQVLEPFEVQIPLKDLPSGQYTVWVNGEKAGNVDVP